MSSPPPADDILLLLRDEGADRRELGAKLRAERDPWDAKLLGERARRKTAAEWLDELEEEARQRPGKAYVSLPGDWRRVLFIVKERGKFVGYEETHGFGGGMCGRVYTRETGELDYFMAGMRGVQRRTRDGALALLEEALEAAP